ncbi:MAG TPA: hypothetical protein VK579_06135 [Terriglobales bacterium]|nr:hypothetical protein [Terriglobales bacterium]
MARFALLVSLVTLFVATSPAQTTPVSDPQALSLVAKSMAAMTGGISIIDVTLNANVAGLIGSDIETGTAILSAKGTGESRVDFQLNSGNRSELRNTLTGLPQGTWTGPKTASTPIAMHNLWTNACWFFPALSDLSGANLGVVLSYVGLESRSGVFVQHLRSNVYSISAINLTAASLVQTLSTTDFFLDASSLLPVAIGFNVHPDGDAGVDIPVEIRFSNYQSIGKAMVPMHLQKYLNGGITLDLVITSVSPNSGLLDTVFNLP